VKSCTAKTGGAQTARRGNPAVDKVPPVSRDDRFTITFPVQPKVTQSTFMSQYGYSLPSRVYTADSGKSRFVVTVVDYNGIQPLGEARAKACPAGASATRS
jgi:hypothetical protein